MRSNAANPTISQLDRIEAKLDQLLAALADDMEEAEESLTGLDGARFGGERDQSQSL